MIAHPMSDADTQAPCEFGRVTAPDPPRLAPRIGFEQDDVKTGLGKLL